MSSTRNIHRRKSSKDQSDPDSVVSPHSPHPHSPSPPTSPNTILFTSTEEKTSPTIVLSSSPPPPPTLSAPPTRRVQHSHSRSASVHVVNANSAPFPVPATGAHPPSAGPYRTTFGGGGGGGLGSAGGGFAGEGGFRGVGGGGGVSSPLRSNFGFPPVPGGGRGGHERTRSVSTPFAPASPSPLASSFAFGKSNGLTAPAMKSPTLSAPSGAKSPSPSSFSFPQEGTLKGPPSPPSTRRNHARLHSRNLSIFFPRPGATPTPTITESDDAEGGVPSEAQGQELEIPSLSPPGVDFPRRAISESHQPPTPLGAGFKFGGRPPALSDVGQEELLTGPKGRRRGHHHKHSLSHNFFSFMEPGASLGSASSDGGEMYTQPTPTPISPWAPISAIPSSIPTSGPEQSTFEKAQLHSLSSHPPPPSPPPQIHKDAFAFAILEFLLGAWVWVKGQQVGSLSLTGVGYWVVFDSFGVLLGWVVPGWVGRGRGRYYGNARLETLLHFAQSVYLMFSSVYVCKETIEHVLLSADSTGGGDGHHHHAGEDLPIEFPMIMIALTLSYLLAMGVLYQNHAWLVSVSGNRIPSPTKLWRSMTSRYYQQEQEEVPRDKVLRALSNPFVAAPVVFCGGLVGVALLPAPHHKLADLLLAALIAIITFNVAYRACVVLGTVLLQTAPPRGMGGKGGGREGRMEGILRVMREVERHPQVLHLPAPHIWQLAPSSSESPHSSSHSLSPSPTSPSSPSPRGEKKEDLVMTVQLHVRDDLPDDEVLKLTRWVWERCVGAVGGGEVCVGVVRG